MVHCVCVLALDGGMAGGAPVGDPDPPLLFCVGLCEVGDAVDPGPASTASLVPTFGWSVVSNGSITAGSSVTSSAFPALGTATSVHVLGVGLHAGLGRVFFCVNGVVHWSGTTLSRDDMAGRRFFVRTQGKGVQFHMTTGPRFLAPLDVLFAGV